MAGVNAAPSFWSRLMGQMPGMVNSLAQNYGSKDLRGAVRASGSAFGVMRKPETSNTGGSEVPGMTRGIVQPPTFRMPNINFGGDGLGVGIWNPRALDPTTGEYTTPILELQGPGMQPGGGIWQAYNRLSGLDSGPFRSIRF